MYEADVLFAVGLQSEASAPKYSRAILRSSNSCLHKYTNKNNENALHAA